VTNPPLDAIREEVVTAVSSTIGPEANLLLPGPESCRQLVLPFPIIDNDELAEDHPRQRRRPVPRPAAHVVSGLYRVAGGGEALRAALDAIRGGQFKAIDDGAPGSSS
jgi:glutamate synthase (NADPH) large chain